MIEYSQQHDFAFNNPSHILSFHWVFGVHFERIFISGGMEKVWLCFACQQNLNYTDNHLSTPSNLSTYSILIVNSAIVDMVASLACILTIPRYHELPNNIQTFEFADKSQLRLVSF